MVLPVTRLWTCEATITKVYTAVDLRLFDSARVDYQAVSIKHERKDAD